MQISKNDIATFSSTLYIIATFHVWKIYEPFCRFFARFNADGPEIGNKNAASHYAQLSSKE